MLKKSLLMAIGGFVFVVGMILFPLPVPFGLPIMIVGIAIMFKTSNKVKRKVIRWSEKSDHTRWVWQKFRVYRRRRKV